MRKHYLVDKIKNCSTQVYYAIKKRIKIMRSGAPLRINHYKIECACNDQIDSRI